MNPTSHEPAAVPPAPGEVLADAVTALFVPGDRPDRFAKAAASGADLVIIDLEDSVAPEQRTKALASACAALSPARSAPAGAAAVPAAPVLQGLVRVTDPSSSTHHDEVHALAEVARQPGHGLLGVMVAKAAEPGLLTDVVDAFHLAPQPIPVVALIESAAGVLAATVLAGTAGVARLAFGALDFALDVGADPASDTVRLARAHLVLASRSAGLPGPLDSPTVQIADLTAVDEAARRARADGFGGQLCIHPAQVEVVRNAFLPNEQERRWADQVLAATTEGASQMEGQMIDRPVLERARRVHRQLRHRPAPVMQENIAAGAHGTSDTSQGRA